MAPKIEIARSGPDYQSQKGYFPMTESSSTVMAILFGLAVFALIVAVGWRSVQNRRILRMQGANGTETIIIAGESDEVTSVATTTERDLQR